MNLLEQAKILIRQNNLKPDKLKGQNFCVDEKILSDMVKAAELSASDTVLEAGAGFGFLTEALVKKAKQVVAVELEPVLARILKNIEAVNKNLQVIEGDILKIAQNLKLKTQGYKIVANLPYSITSVFLKKFLTSDNQPLSMTLLLQREVAERICALPGQMSLLALSVQLYAQPQIVSFVKQNSFWPQPKVESAIINIKNIKPFPYQDVSEQLFWRVLRSGFASKRKTLLNNLSNSWHSEKSQIAGILAKISLKNTVRAQELNLDNWRQLAVLCQNKLKQIFTPFCT